MKVNRLPATLFLQDLFHPLTSLKCSEYSGVPASVYNTQAVIVNYKVYIGGESINSGWSSSRLLIYDFTEDSWDTLSTHTHWYALTTYRSQLVLVGGRNATTWITTNELWALDEQYKLTKPPPPMKMKRYQASAVSVGDYLIVAGGCGGHYAGDLDAVEVYNGHMWRQVQSLPRPCSSMKSAVLEGNWYLVGQHYEEVYHTSLKGLIASSHSEEAGQTSVWKNLPGMPLKLSTPTKFLNQLIAVGRGPSGSALHAYSPSINSWVHVGDLPVACHSTCTLVLPTGELLVVGEKTQYECPSLSFRVNVQGDLNVCICGCVYGWIHLISSCKSAIKCPMLKKKFIAKWHFINSNLCQYSRFCEHLGVWFRLVCIIMQECIRMGG